MNHDTFTTHLLRTPDQVKQAIDDLLSVGVPNVSFRLVHSPGSSPRDPAAYFGVIECGPWDHRQTLISREQVNAVVDRLAAELSTDDRIDLTI